MFTVTYKGFPVACETAQDAVEFIDTADQPSPSRARITAPATTAPTTRRKPKRTTPSKAEKQKRNAKARAAYRAKHPEKTTTTTSRLEALPSKPTSIGKPDQKRARTSAAVVATLKRSPSPLTLDEIDTDLEKSGWPYKGADRKGAIRATLSRLSANGTVASFMRGTGLDAMKMFRLERTNGDTPSPVEQVLNGEEEEQEQEEEPKAEPYRF